MSDPVVTFLLRICDPVVTDAISDQLWANGVQAIEEIDAADGIICLRSSFGVDERETHQRLRGLLTGLEDVVTWDVSQIDASVVDTWKSFIDVVEITPRMRVVPDWLEAIRRDDTIDVRIDPGATFGMGDHPTTRGVLTLLCDLVRPGDTVLDVGCGSGVLGIASVLLGASGAHGVDINPASVPVSRANARRNAVEERWSVSTEDLSSVIGQFDIVVANILAPVLIELSADLKRVLQHHGTIVVSGLLTGRFDHVVEALSPLKIVESVDIDGWSTLALQS